QSRGTDRGAERGRRLRAGEVPRHGTGAGEGRDRQEDRRTGNHRRRGAAEERNQGARPHGGAQGEPGQGQSGGEEGGSGQSRAADETQGCRGGRGRPVTRILAGTSGWSFKEWKGSFYPKELP